jgi:integral membrane protein
MPLLSVVPAIKQTNVYIGGCSESMSITQTNSQSDPLRFLRWVGVFEGFTLILLMLVAVPIKRLLGVAEMVTWVGPVHGVAFLVYLYAVVEAWSAGDLSRRRLAFSLLACFIPFGTWFNNRYLRRPAKNAWLSKTKSERSMP